MKTFGRLTAAIGLFLLVADFLLVGARSVFTLLGWTIQPSEPFASIVGGSEFLLMYSIFVAPVLMVCGAVLIILGLNEKPK